MQCMTECYAKNNFRLNDAGNAALLNAGMQRASLIGDVIREPQLESRFEVT